MASILIVTACSSQFVKFEPLKLQEGAQNELVLAPELVTQEYLRRVKLVLEFYGQPYKTNDSGELLILAKLASDKELLWNYSKKATDDVFIEQAHKLKSSN